MATSVASVDRQVCAAVGGFPLRAACDHLRPARLTAHVATVPLAALVIGMALPEAGDAVRPMLPAFVALMSFTSIASLKTAPPTRQDAAAALLMSAVTWVTCLLTLTALAEAGLPPDLAMATALAAASPVAMGTAARCRRFGLPERPAVWAAVGGMALAPLMLPLVAGSALAGAADTASALSPSWELARRGIAFGALPAVLACTLRRTAPGQVAAYAPDLRGLGVLALAAMGLCSGASLAHAVTGLSWAGCGAPLGLAALVQGVAVLLAWAIASCTGRQADAGLRRSLLLAAASRNSTVAWAAAAGVLTQRAESVLALTLAAAFVLPSLLLAWDARRPGGEPRS